MRNLTLSDMDARLDPVQAERVKREFMLSVLNEKGAWMERTMKPILPPNIYRMVWDESGTEDQIEQRRAAVQKYLESQDIRIEEHGLNARIMRGRKQIGQAFVVKLAEK